MTFGLLGLAVLTTAMVYFTPSCPSDEIEPAIHDLTAEGSVYALLSTIQPAPFDTLALETAGAEAISTEATPIQGDGGECLFQKPLSEVELAEVLQSGYESYFGHAPTASRMACAWAHCAFEHGRGQKLFGNNLGHITTTGVWKGPTCVKSFTQRVAQNPDRWEATTQSFRVHPTLAAGSIDYWKLMDKQYPGVLMACDRGNALEAATELRRRHYFTGPEKRYVHSLAQLYLEALGKVLPNTQQPPWPIGPKR